MIREAIQRRRDALRQDHTRRAVLTEISLALSAAAGAVVTLPIVAYLLSPLINPSPRVWIDVGPLDRFKVGATEKVDYEDPSPVAWAGQTARTSMWLRRSNQNEFIAYAVNCTHLGCPVNWRAEANLFLCPCHGGVYYKDGAVAAGPPPQPLTKYPVRIVSGQVEIETSPIPIT